MDLFKTIEHQSFSEEIIRKIKSLHLDFSYQKDQVKFLGLNPNMMTSYYIGVDWLKENEAIIKVDPKIKGLDFMKMFLECLHTPYLNERLGKIYHIDLDRPVIEIDSLPCDITPMLIIHFISVVKSLSKKGLKKDYVRIEENLQSKIKGKIKFSQHVKYNLSKGRLDKNYCNYQEYSIDCVENQLLKKTLLFAASFVNKYYPNKQLQENIQFCLSAFDQVSDNIDAVLIKQVLINPIYKEYAEALKLSKLILKRFAYSISETAKNDKNKIPPFWVDMSLLFELYVLGKLINTYGSTIKYQAHGKYGSVDFMKIDEKIVIDTKYKLIYNENRFDIDNIRQVSGYARDRGIRKKLNTSQIEKLDCCIIYPDVDKPLDFKERKLLNEQIEQFEKFWKIGISLPKIS